VSDPVNAQHASARQNAASGDATAANPGLEDAVWVKAARGGDTDAFDHLVQRYQRRAVSVAFRLLGNAEDARDVAQDAFLRAYRSLKKLQDPRRFGGWLMRIVTNLALNRRRDRSRSPVLSTDDLVEGHETLRTASGATMGTSAATDDAGELGVRVRAAIDELPEKQRLALILFSIEGLPQKEVAEIMDCSVQLVKWNVFQARKTLRAILADDLS
jgi:RNA polymerase sigma-70 factor (ECF subfamily)